MSTRCVVLVADTFVLAGRLRRRGSWHVEQTAGAARTDTATPDTDAESIADAIVAALESLGVPVRAIDLIVPAQWCFVRRLEMAEHRFRPAPATYQLEPFLPHTLENVVCSFVHDASATVWGVAAPIARLRSLLDHVEARSVTVEHLRVDLFAGIAALASEGQPGDVLLLDQTRAAFARVGEDGMPEWVRSIHLPSTDPQAYLQRQLNLTADDPKMPLSASVVWDLRAASVSPETVSDTPVDEDSPGKAMPGSWQPRPLTELLTAAARGDRQPDLRTDSLARGNGWSPVGRKVRACLAILAALLLVLAFDTHRQRATAQRDAQHLREQQAIIYREVFGTAAPPAGAALRVASERRRLEAVTRRSDQASVRAAEIARPRLQLLADIRDWASRIPDDVRILVSELHVDAQQLSLRGQTRDHRDAERIGESVARDSEFETSPPRTSRLASGGVEFSIRARRINRNEPGTP
ncbi:MAG: hypothetical protein JXB13_01510 [Phycisphaerae bacterium]|nr:hypothetical protein [Phycisphaerae bacterium]